MLPTDSRKIEKKQRDRVLNEYEKNKKTANAKKQSCPAPKRTKSAATAAAKTPLVADAEAAAARI